MAGESGTPHLKVSNLLTIASVLGIESERGFGSTHYPRSRDKYVHVEIAHGLDDAGMEGDVVDVPLEFFITPLENLQEAGGVSLCELHVHALLYRIMLV